MTDIDLDALELANLGKVVRPEDWNVLLAYARALLAASPAGQKEKNEQVRSEVDAVDGQPPILDHSTNSDASYRRNHLPIATITSADEYGPMIEWRIHWSELVGVKLYASPAGQDARDAKRFVAFVGALVADANGESLTETQRRIRAAFRGQGKLTIETVRKCVDAATAEGDSQ
ncbi:hypothetical protein RA280_15120 [Cupriavidus sp. CV2]|uniref:hypothetical protein n=1 Tax=Cupriavidus ulmosensis TaxID=3065913 RepID=UPI00296AD3AF|nr:hypothetical protein [Cupriavidus sp. CV2]MDW3683055.1 hypothetical protein [Cupriavidus sp. CV2]